MVHVHTAVWVSSAAILMTAVSCSTGPSPPAKGTPAFYWAAAQENYKTGDYIKASEQLEQLTKSDNEYSARAWPWRLVLLSGLAQGYIDLADHFEYGARANKANPSPFRKYVSDYRSNAQRLTLQFAEAYKTFEKKLPEKMELAFDPPMGTANQPAVLTKVSNGILATPGEIEPAQRDMLRRSVLLSACRAAGSPKDAAKLAELLKSGQAAVPRNVFVQAMAESLVDQAALFERQKLDLPDRRKFFLSNAIEALKTLPESKEIKEVRLKAESGLKKM